MKEIKRSIRRHHKERLVRLRRDYWGWNDLVKNPNPRRSGMIVNNPCSCSCWMCTSPRKVNGNGKAALTLQEQSDLEVLKFE